MRKYKVQAIHNGKRFAAEQVWTLLLAFFSLFFFNASVTGSEDLSRLVDAESSTATAMAPSITSAFQKKRICAAILPV